MLGGVEMEIIERNIEELIPYGQNQKIHNEQQIRNIANSLKRFGWQQPIVVDDNDVVVIGHGRLLAAKLLGMDTVPCKRAGDFTDDEIRELRIADNKLNESPWDFKQLEKDLSELTFEGFEFEKVEELSQTDIDDLLEDAEKNDKKAKKIQCPCCGEWFEA